MIYKLGDLISIKHGYAFKGESISFEDNSVVLVTPGNFRIGGGFQEEKCKFYHDVDYPNEYVLSEGDLVVTMTDLSKEIDTLGYGALIPYSEKRIYLHNQRIGLVVIKSEKILKEYLYWFLRTKNYQKQVASSSSGSTVHHTSPGRICEIEIDLPPIETQKKIAAFLTAIQNKIDNNLLINKNLEDQIKLLFLQKGKNKCCRVEPIKKLPLYITDYVANGSFASLKENVALINGDGYAYFIRNTDLKDKVFNTFVDEKSYNFLKKSSLFGNEIIVSNVGDIGSVFLCPVLDKPMTLGNNIIMIRPEEENLKYYLYCYLKWFNGQQKMQAIKGGSAVPKFNKTEFKNIDVELPSNTDLSHFDELVSPLFSTIRNNNESNDCLMLLLQTVLPKIMNGDLVLEK